jgi:hypothetical protein
LTPPTPRRLRAWAALGSVAVLGAVALASELVLPGLAGDRLRARLDGRFSDVRSVEVSATPALRLLWSDPGDVRVALGDSSYARERRRPVKDLARVDHVDLTADALHAGRLTLERLELTKRGDDIAVAFTLTGGNAGTLEPAAARDGTLELHVQTPFGGTARLAVTARDGSLTLEGGGGAPTAFSRSVPVADGLQVESIRAEPGAGGPRVTVQARTTA